jgi:hypothetical protein
MYLLYIFPPEAVHTYDFVVLTSLTHPRKIRLVVLQIGKAKDISAARRSHTEELTEYRELFFCKAACSKYDIPSESVLNKV